MAGGDGEFSAFVHFENVPRITSRGADILKRIKQLLERYGYVVDMRADHNLGEIGGLGQNRLRFLLLARNQKRVPNWCYLPPKKQLRTIGDVLGPLPLHWAGNGNSHGFRIDLKKPPRHRIAARRG